MKLFKRKNSFPQNPQKHDKIIPIIYRKKGNYKKWNSKSPSPELISVKSNNYKGFTLAEVLITLVIIGIVAAITVTSILQSTKRQETVSKLKKAYSVLQQAIIKIATDEGVPVGDFSLMSNDEFFDKFANAVNTTKLCKRAAGCFSNKPLKALNGGDWSVYNTGNSLITADGIAFCWNKNESNYCTNKGISQ